MDELERKKAKQRRALLAELVATLNGGLVIVDQLPDLTSIGARLQNIIDDVQAEMI